MKDTDSASWFINLRDALYKFELQLLENPPEKLQWERNVKTAVHEYCQKRVQQDIPLCTSLRYFKETDCTPGLCHDTLNMSCVMRKSTFWFPTWSNTNQAVQLQKMARGLKFRI